VSKSDDVQQAAADWWSRMQGPDAARDRGAFEKWLNADPRHATEYAALERTWMLSDRIEDTVVGQGRDLSRARASFAWATTPRLVLATAALALVVAVPFALRAPGPAPSEVVAVAHATSVGEIRTLTLPDGSLATLDTDTRIEIRYSNEARTVRVSQGRARFDVRSDPKRRFVVEAGGKLLSTQEANFDVQLARQGLCVTSLRGAIEIRSVGESSTAPVALASNAMLRFDTRGAPLAPSPAPKGADRWAQGMLVYQAVPLASVLEETNRYSRRRILLGDPSLGALRVTGTFRPVPVDELAASLAAAFSLAVREDAQGNLLLSRR
jgi:transmembrane sensor